MPKPHISIELHENKSKEGQRNRKYSCTGSPRLTATIVVVVVNMSFRNQLSDYELREFFRSLQDLLALSLDANLSINSVEFLSRRLDGFERALSVLSSRVHVSHPSERQLLSDLDILLHTVSQQRQYCVNLSYFAVVSDFELSEII